MAMCFICLESIVQMEKSIKIGSTIWEEYNIKNLIEKHLWPMENTKENANICSLCLLELRNFHNFYSRVEAAHKGLNSLLSAKVDPIEEDNRPKDMQLGILESDVAIGQNWPTEFVIKHEIEEETPSYIRDTNHSPEQLSEMQTDSELLKICDTVNSKNNVENYEMLPVFETKTDCSSANADEDSFPSSSTDSLQSREAQNSSAKNSFRNKLTSKAASLKSYHTSKTNREELDKFLEEHFKFICCKCHINFATFQLMCQHFSQVHKERGYATCCEMKFNDRGRLADHVKCHLNSEYFKCKECGKVLKNRRCLWTHLKVHQDKEFQCDICGRRFTMKVRLERHKLLHTAPVRKEHYCRACGKLFANETILGLHMERHAKSRSASRSSTLKCEECGRVYIRPMQLKRHREREHPVGSNRK